MRGLFNMDSALPVKRFTRNTEDFICANCGAEVKGSGYTNHCPICLWSQHVDVFPGDRREMCQGRMEPMGIDTRGGEYTILHRCVRCGFSRRNKTAPNDSFEAILSVSQKKV